MKRLRVAAALAATVLGALVVGGRAGADTLTMSMTPTVVAPGSSVTVSSVTPCAPAEAVAVLFNAAPSATVEADTVADATGAWSASFTVPLTVPVGTYGVQAACSPLGSFREYTPLALTVKYAVTLVAKPILGSGGTYPNLSGVLTRTADGAPIVGAVLRFTSLKNVFVCQGITLSTGTASCRGAAKVLLGGGYYVSYAGDATHLAAITKGHTLNVVA
jgi:glycine/D-amino acid oxidase-like deaminating enzyme